MFLTSLFSRVIGHPFVVLVFCFCVVNYFVTPVDVNLDSNGINDFKTSEKKVKIKNVPSQAEPEGTVDETDKINNSSDVSSEDTSERTPSKPLSAVENNTTGNYGSPPWFTSIKSGALERTGFVALGIMSILLFFFVIRAVRIRRKKSKSRKYGIITSTASDMEMEPLDRGDEDEEETTLFDAQHHKYTLK